MNEFKFFFEYFMRDFIQSFMKIPERLRCGGLRPLLNRE